MDVYIYLYLFLILLVIFKRNTVLVLISFSILLVISSIRSFNVGTDTITYFEIFKYFEEGGYSSLYTLSFIEPGWFAINWISFQLFNDFRGVMFLSSLLVLIPIFIRAWNNKHITHWVILYYVLLYFYINSFNITRQMISVSIVFYAYDYLINGFRKKYIFSVLCASLFHYSAIICLLIPIMVKLVKLNASFIIFSLLISYIMGIYLLPSLLPKIPYIGGYSFYFMDSNASGSFSRILLNIFFVFIYFLCDVRYLKLYLKLFFIGIILYNLLAFSPAAARIALYFIVSQLIILPNLNSQFYWNQLSLKLLSLIYASIYYYTMLRVNSGEVVPYES